MLYKDGIDLKKISETHTPEGSTITTINKDGTKKEVPYGEIVRIVYECPCGKGKVQLTLENIPGYSDYYTSFNCADCREKYEILWGQGVSPGHSPMVRRK